MYELRVYSLTMVLNPKFIQDVGMYLFVSVNRQKMILHKLSLFYLDYEVVFMLHNSPICISSIVYTWPLALKAGLQAEKRTLDWMNTE